MFKKFDPSKLIDVAAHQRQQLQESIEILGDTIVPEEVSQKIETVKSTIDTLQETADELKNTYDKLIAKYEQIEAECKRQFSENGENSNCSDSSDTDTESFEKL